MSPASIRPCIPVIVAADGPKALAVVAEHADGWATFPGAATAEDFRRTAIERGRVLDRLCEDRGRDPGALHRILLAYGAINPWAARPTGSPGWSTTTARSASTRSSATRPGPPNGQCSTRSSSDWYY